MTSQKSSEELKTRTPKRQRGHDRVVVLLEAAARVFARKGYEAATMTEIAAEAQSSIGSLYQFFPTKPLLAEALHIDRLERLKAGLQNLAERSSGLSAADSGEAIFDALGAFIEEFPEFPVLAARRDIPKDRKMRSRAELKELIAAVLRRAEPSISDDITLMSGIVLELLRIAAAVANEPDAKEDQRVVSELRLMLRRRLEEATSKT
ncbi:MULTISPECIES: TetR/AcrR family transcriptional regulator [Rhizobium]|jgi:AcrR family transcriptional regulator|uniref:TetR/AcrR family transcriptional regulator n=1 Tax=Rhizobium TaxID=379 RepID=UPI00056B317C|nr:MULTISPECIES: TetR/AcrR family transcriptional regulator [Rhizobium]NKJ04823.1 AcrR family transcriptional regulator [Rhizobium sp. SG741]NTJ05564.1 TetR/AcrR family transcriptional regulator [Rhizobium lusitanum]